MKKYMFMAVAGMLALSSCSNDDNEQNPQNAPRQMTFTAGFGDGTQTRTTLNADKSVSFDANDAISIFSENNDNVEFTTTDGGATADFTGTAVAGDATYYAVYPYKDSYTFSGGIVSGVTIENYQPVNTYAGQTWFKSSVISYATTTGSELQFHNACALLKITNNTDMTEIQISADQSLAGTFDLNTSTGALTVTDGKNTVGTYISADNATVYLAIAPGTYTNFTAAKSSVYDAGTWYSKTKASVTFAAGKIYDLGTTSSWMAAPAATVTTAPTATSGDIEAGSTTALVSAGTATGGTMMYKVTNTDSQPASTDGFSATVPTAQSLAAGTYYVWYYVQADASHTDSEISATGIEVTVKAATPSETISLINMGNSISGTNFDVAGEGDSDEDGKQVSKFNPLTITAKNSKTIKEVVFTYGALSQNAGTLSADSGSYDGVNTITGINASSLTISSSNAAGVFISSVKIYY